MKKPIKRAKRQTAFKQVKYRVTPPPWHSVARVGKRADTADAVETAIDRSKKDEKLTWEELDANRHRY